MEAEIKKPVFQIGAVVRLKSGGPPMTVSSERGPAAKLVSVNWFREAELVRDCFDPEQFIEAEVEPA